MSDQKKIFGEERRELLLQILKESDQPVTGSELAAKANVSRQVIVGDITLLKARSEPIIATSQGYIRLNQASPVPVAIRTIASYHPPDRTEEELNLLVDYGVTVKDVTIEHPVYGDLTASIMVSNRKEVKHFMDKIHSTGSAYLSELTGGIHLHTISASHERKLDEAEQALKEKGFLVE
ncbi:transcription repressor NadR [Cytobacillus purgationiresistens]|uniref:Transcriptional regulator of NAD metabolism n=1 Tax=Cytobacillus purgationiresistens TaxID=863449 RepID=A0ABU0AF63_9BACI|nr:transcription repressor NadR [Cytobacillus purgationiresistens]MDQ0269894.1 transcriptional regulator of NAD metabolism [Cytobacillus purgationiresistens]